MNVQENDDREGLEAYYHICLAWPGWDRDSTERHLQHSICGEIESQLDQREPGRFRFDDRGRLQEHPNWIVVGRGKVNLSPRGIHDILRNAYLSIFPDKSFPEHAEELRAAPTSSPESTTTATHGRLSTLLGRLLGPSKSDETVRTPQSSDAGESHARQQMHALQAAFSAAYVDCESLVSGIRRWLAQMQQMREPREVISVEIPDGRRMLALRINGLPAFAGSDRHAVTLNVTLQPELQMIVKIKKGAMVSLADSIPALRGVVVESLGNAVRISVTSEYEAAQVTCIENESENCSIAWRAGETPLDPS